MKTGFVKFEINGMDVTVNGYPELEGCTGILDGDGMAFFFFFGKSRKVIVANTRTGKIRKLVTDRGELLVEDKDIDLDAIQRECIYGVENAKRKEAPYATVNRWDGFHDGL